MNQDISPLSLEPQVLDGLAQRMVEIGVVSDEDGGWLTRSGMTIHREEIEHAIRERGYSGGALIHHSYERGDDGWASIFYDSQRFEHPRAAEQAWEMAHYQAKKAYVESRVADWLNRLKDLRDSVESWTSKDPKYTIGDKNPVFMKEEMMDKFSINPVTMPCFEVLFCGKRAIRFQPKGLWTIGANGRVDLITRASSPILVDMSRPLSGMADWRVVYPGKSGESKKFNENELFGLISESLAL